MIKMKFGEYKGVCISEIPAKYLIYIHNFKKLPKRIRLYTSENYEAMKNEVEANSVAQMSSLLSKMETKKV